MNSLRIKCEMISPIELPKNEITFDSLMYWALQQLNGENHEQSMALLDTVLAKKNDIYRASSLRFIRSLAHPMQSCATAHPTVSHWAEFPYELSKSKSIIVEKSGVYRKRMTKRNAIRACFVDFHVVGDEQKISYLLSTSPFIGISNNQGFGEVGNFTIERSPEDFSFFDEDGKLARKLPVDQVKNADDYFQMDCSYKPNYKTSQVTTCCIPDFRLLTLR